MIDFKFNFMEEVDVEADRKDYADKLAMIAKWREKNIPNVFEYTQKESPEISYLYLTNEVVHPLYSESDGYGTVHIWIKDGVYSAGVEIERRYLPNDPLQPKIKVYDIIPDSILTQIKTLINL